MKKFLIACILFLIPFGVSAQDISVESLSDQNKDFTFTALPGTTTQGVFVIKNTGTHAKEIDVFTALREERAQENNQQEQHLFSTMVFYTTPPPDDAQKIFARNRFDIIALCAHVEDADLQAWCQGERRPHFTLAPDETARLRYTVTFPQDALDRAQSVLIVQEAGDIKRDDADIVRIPLGYQPPIRREHHIRLDEVRLRPSISLWDFWGWAQQHFRSAYDVTARLTNQSTNQKVTPLPYHVAVVVTPVRFYSQRTITQEGALLPDETAQHDFVKVSVPRFGSTLIDVIVTYDDANGQEQRIATEPVRIFFFPVREAISGIVLVICLWLLRIFLRKKSTIKGSKVQKQRDLSQQEETPRGHVVQTIAEKSTGAFAQHTEKSQILVDEKIVYNGKHMTKQKQQKHSDLEWMREDHGFSDALRAQEKRLNRRIMAVVILLPIIIAVAVYLFLRENQDVFVQQQQKSIRDLTVDEQHNDEQDVVTQEENSSESSAQEKDAEATVSVIAPEDTTVLVLNGGAKAGAAGVLTKTLQEQKYNTLPASNAQNTIEGAVIYYTTPYEGTAKQLNDLLAQQRNDVKREVSDTVTKEHHADIVIVIGAPGAATASKENTTETQKEQQKEKVLTVQVLDGGSAGESLQRVYDTFRDAGYQMKDLASAKNKTTDTIIYHNADVAQEAQEAKKILQKLRSTVAVDRSDAVAKRYDADLVIVVGAE